MLSAENLASIESEGRRLVAAARRDPERPVPFYPGWTLRDLVVHTGSMHGRATTVVEGLLTDKVGPVLPPDGAEVFTWYEDGLDSMLAALTSADPASPCWGFVSEATVGFWERRMVIETGLHRWDAHSAFGEEDRLTDRVATSGLDEFPDLWMLRLGEVDSLILEAVDMDRKWDYGDGPDPVAIDGTASDLFLRLMSRASPVMLPDDWSEAIDSLAIPSRP